MSKIIRSLAITVRSIDESEGTATFVITSAAVDSYNESVDPRGCNLMQFNRNSPLLDSHQYGTIRSQLGSVTRVYRKPEVNGLLADCKFAIDVPENEDARFAFGMIKSGYLKACSIGFEPNASLTPRDEDYDNVREELGLADHEKPDRIYTDWTLRELSCCVLGANPDALVAMRRTGAISERDAAALRKKIIVARSRFTETSREKDEGMSTNFLKQIGQITGTASRRFDDLDRETRRSFDDIEKARRDRSGNELRMAVRSYRQSEQREQRGNFLNVLCGILTENPAIATFLNVIFRLIGGVRLDTAETKPFQDMGWITEKALLLSDPIAAFPQPVASLFVNLLLLWGGAVEVLSVIMDAEKERFSKISGLPTAYFITPTQTLLSGRVITSDATLGGASSDQIANTLAIIIDASREALADGKRVNEPVIIEVMTQGLWQRLETSIMVGTGADDTSSGLITGLYSDNTITSVNAGAGNVTVAQLQREDFTRCIGAISPGALMRTENCVWFISPTFIPSLLSIKAGPSGQFLLKTPSETGSDYWMLCGFRVVWTGGSPSTDGAGKQVACFANTNGYAVPIREQMELMGSESGAKFSSNIRQIRALMRCMAFTRDAASLAVLKTAAL